MRIVLSIAALLALSVSLPAQLVGAVLSPNPVQAGNSVSMTAFDSTGLGFAYFDQCITMHTAPNGPVVPWQVLNCGGCQTVGPNGSFRAAVSIPLNATPGIYWLRFETYTGQASCGTVAPWTEWMCFTVAGGTDPATLQPVRNSPQRGRTWELTIGQVVSPGAPYAVAGSFSTNVGQNLGPVSLCLDNDALFQLSFPNALPSLFSNFVGSLDGRGNASGILINVPNDPAVEWAPVHFQGAVVLPTGGISVTNVVNEIIYP